VGHPQGRGVRSGIQALAEPLEAFAVRMLLIRAAEREGDDVLAYPGAYATHAVWAAVLLWLMVRGPGVVSLDHQIARR
jgi:putative oxidoreductase